MFVFGLDSICLNKCFFFGRLTGLCQYSIFFGWLNCLYSPISGFFSDNNFIIVKLDVF